MAALEQPHATPVAVDIDGMSEDELEERAYTLEQEAEQHRILERSLRVECARLRSRAERMRAEEARQAEKTIKKGRRKPELPYDPNDGLIAAAILATEDLGAAFGAGDLAQALHVGQDRAVKLLLAIQDRGLVARMGELGQAGKWRCVDPNQALVRDAARRLGRFTVEQLGEELHMTPAELTYYIEWMQDEGMIVGGGPMFEMRKLDPETTITKVNDGRYRLPEHDPPAGTDAPKRGEPVFTQNHGKRGQAGQNPQSRHQMHQRDARREAQDKARAERAEKARARSQSKKDPHAAKRAKSAAKRRARLIS